MTPAHRRERLPERRARRVGTREREDGLTARLSLEGRWLEQAGFQPGTQYTATPVARGLLLTPSQHHTTGYDTSERDAPAQLSYEPWLTRLRLDRLHEQPPPLRIVDGPDDAYAVLRDLGQADREYVATLLLGGRNQVVGVDMVSVGSINACGVEPREVYRAAIHSGSSGVILAHNHPSGDPTPSQEDFYVTIRMRRAGEVVGIPLLDHLVIGHDTYSSLRNYET